MRKTIAIINQKGGVAKTTTVLEAGYHIAKQGLKCLIVDMDPQCNATKRLTGTSEHSPSLFDVMVNGPKRLAEAFRASSEPWPETLFLLPASPELGNIGPHLQAKMEKEKVLKRTLDQVSANFDCILLDLSPEFGILHINALVAADAYVVPCNVCDDARDGASTIRSMAQEIIDCGLNPNLEFIGVLMTRFQAGRARYKGNKRLLSGFQTEYADLILPLQIPEADAVQTAQADRKPVGFTDPKHPVSLAYESFSRTLIGAQA